MIASRLVVPLQDRSFRRFWFGQLVSGLGDSVFYVAQSWYVLQETGSPARMASVAVATQIPHLAFLLLGGALADRYPRRLVALWSDLVRAALLLIISALLWRGQLEVSHLIYLGFAFGLVSGWGSPAFRALNQVVAPEADRAAVASLRSLGGMILSIGGPVIGGAVMAFGGAKLAFLLNGLSFLIGALGIWGVRIPKPAVQQQLSGASLPGGRTEQTGRAADQRTEQTGGVADECPPAPEGGDGQVATARLSRLGRLPLFALLGDLGGAFRFLLARKPLLGSILLMAVVNVVGQAPVITLRPFMAARVGGGPATLSLALSVFAAGICLSVVIIGSLKVRRRLVVSWLGIAAAGLIMLGLASVGALLPYLALEFLLGGAVMVYGILWEALLQETVPPEQMGRIGAVDELGRGILYPLGLSVVGFLAEGMGAGPVMAVGGGLTLLLALVGMVVSRGELVDARSPHVEA